MNSLQLSQSVASGVLSGRDVAGDVDNDVASGMGVDTDFAVGTDFGDRRIRYDLTRPVVES